MCIRDRSTGAQYVILGHSERRQYYGETAEILKEKVELALANGLKAVSYTHLNRLSGGAAHRLDVRFMEHIADVYHAGYVRVCHRYLPAPCHPQKTDQQDCAARDERDDADYQMCIRDRFSSDY